MVLVEAARSSAQAHLGGSHSEWSPDGTRIAYNNMGKIWITSLASKERVELQTGLPEEWELSEFGWSPDGEKIVFLGERGRPTPELWLISDFLPEER